MEGEVMVGIDVSKARLDVAVLPGEEIFREEHDSRGIAALIERLKKIAPALVVLEASGGLETGLVAELVAAGLPAAVVNPRQVRDFARATGQLAKTDKLDARMLARFGERIRPQLRKLPVCVEFQFRRQLGSEISLCNVAARNMTQVLPSAVGARRSVEPA